MPWNPDDPDIGYALMETGEPPETIEEIRDDETWLWIFGCWSADLDSNANTLYHRLKAGEDPQYEITPWFIEEGRVRFTNAVVDLRARIIEAVRERQETQKADADAALYAEWAAQNADPAATNVDSLVIDDAVRAAVTEVNRQELGKLDVGDEVEYRQVGGLVLIGEGQRWEYYVWAYRQEGYAGGTITVKSRSLRQPKPTRRPDETPEGGDTEKREKEKDTEVYIEVTGCAGSDRDAFLGEVTGLGRLDRLGELDEKRITHK